MRLKLFITGLVQGVGFRPFVYRVAKELSLRGYVLNSESGVVVEVEGEKERLEEFLKKLQTELPPAARIFSIDKKFLDDFGYSDFEIRRSEKRGEVNVSVLPDLATCRDCLRELFDKSNRRYRYPFINCTNCGPRYTIILSLPYDRENTTMKKFKMCPECYREYTDPSNRRFHAQPNACPECGPHVELLNEKGERIGKGESALKETVRFLKEGKILAVKGLGGFHLVCDATNEKAVRELRRRKRREEKPFAVMFKDLDQLKEYAEVSKLEEIALTSVETPIVILKRKESTDLAPSISPDTKTVGAFLPYTPLHHILLRDFGKPIVATSCNLTDEPIMYRNEEVENVLGKLVDGALIHNRDIARRCDDSVVRVISGRIVPIRRSRGYAPLPVILPFKLKRPVLALGPHMKVTVAVGKEDKVYISQHIGDIDNLKAEEFLKETVRDLTELFELEPEVVVTDYHPGYFTTKFGKELFQERVRQVYHHHAHTISVMAENEVPLEERVISFSFDGTGYGKDGKIWGGEVLTASYTDFEREFHLRYFPLPGGDKAVKEPYRTAVSLLMEVEKEPRELLNVEAGKVEFVKQMVLKGVNSPLTSSMGRLFDGVSSILGIRNYVSYHAQGAILLEELSMKSITEKSYPFEIEGNEIDWRPIILGILEDLRKGVSPEEIGMKFHNTVVDIIVKTAQTLRDRTGIGKVALSGGVFQNKILVEKAFKKLSSLGFKPIIHQLVPPNDGGISLGQAVYGGLI
jgi:hydrogenase maturation protein HypF